MTEEWQPGATPAHPQGRAARVAQRVYGYFALTGPDTLALPPAPARIRSAPVELPRDVLLRLSTANATVGGHGKPPDRSARIVAEAHTLIAGGRHDSNRKRAAQADDRV